MLPSDQTIPARSLRCICLPASLESLGAQMYQYPIIRVLCPLYVYKGLDAARGNGAYLLSTQRPRSPRQHEARVNTVPSQRLRTLSV